MKYIIVPEFISCVLLALISVYMMFDKKTASPKEITFRITLAFSILSIVNNIISIYAIENAAKVPVLINIYLNTFYYFSVAVMTTMVSITTYFTMFEGRYSEPRLKGAIVVSLCFFALEVALVLVNLETGLLFYFDENHPIIHFLNIDDEGNYVDNTLGRWSETYDYYLIRTIEKESFFNINKIFSAYRKELKSKLPWYVRWFSDYEF